MTTPQTVGRPSPGVKILEAVEEVEKEAHLTHADVKRLLEQQAELDRKLSRLLVLLGGPPLGVELERVRGI